LSFPVFPQTSVARKPLADGLPRAVFIRTALHSASSSYLIDIVEVFAPELSGERHENE
jgi:hypothetical protein